jgi:hypothetical protein
MTKLETELIRLAGLPLADLRNEWQAAYGGDAPTISPALLRLGIAYRWQEKALGKLPARVAQRLSGGRTERPTPLSPGTQLVRGWNGRTVSVMVTEGGFSFEDQTYRSLSAIAREVTGTAWSGPRFFGLDGGGAHG